MSTRLITASYCLREDQAKALSKLARQQSAAQDRDISASELLRRLIDDAAETALGKSLGLSAGRSAFAC